MSKKRKIFGEIPKEISTNLQAPELTPSDKRFTGRTKQLNFKVREEFYWQLKNRAVEEKCMLVEVLERAFEEYEQKKQAKSGKKLKKYVETIKPKSKKMFSYPNKSFDCDNCKGEFQNETAYSYVANLTKIAKTYCGRCKEMMKNSKIKLIHA
jgi:hypothetical protein